MEYKIFKLKSGEEIITEVKELTKGKYILDRPMIFRTTTLVDKTGRPYDLMMLKDWLVHSDTKIIELPKNHVATSFNPTSDITKMYEIEKGRSDKEQKQADDAKKNTKNNILEQLFGDMFGDIQQDIENQTNEQMKSLDSPDAPPFYPPEDTNQQEFPSPFDQDMIPMVSISMLFPPEVILDLLDSGILDPKELLRLVRRIERLSGKSSSGRKKAKKKNPFPKLEKLSENERKIDDEPIGCNWKDWPENAWDLIDKDINKDGLTGA